MLGALAFKLTSNVSTLLACDQMLWDGSSLEGVPMEGLFGRSLFWAVTTMSGAPGCLGLIISLPLGSQEEVGRQMVV